MHSVTKMKKNIFLTVAAALLGMIALTGCGKPSDAPKTNQEVKDFKGGPAPANAMSQMGMPAGQKIGAPPPGAQPPAPR